MIESPLIQELMDERDVQTKQADIVRFLTGRFGELPESLRSRLTSVQVVSTLDALIDTAARCDNLDEFENAIPKD